MRIAVIGTGYVGLVTGVGFAELGHDVTCVDIDEDRIDALRRDEIPIHEPGLAELLRRNRELQRLHFTTSTEQAVGPAQIVFIAVGTPSTPRGAADLSYVLDAAREIGCALRAFTIVVTKSTVPVGTSDRIRDVIAAETTCPFAVASNPEFLKEGDALNDFLKPARVVIGADDPRAVEMLLELYRPVMWTTDRMIVMTIRSAELTKYAANALLATRISFMNELSLLARECGADIESVRVGIGTDPRIGPKHLFAGAGFGGSCLPKDLRALIHNGREHDVQLTIVQAVEAANEKHKRTLGQRVIAHFGGQLSGRRIAIWGLAYKPDTDDIRESPALTLIQQLRDAGATIVAYDPAAMANTHAAFGDTVELARDAYAATVDADALVLVTAWHELRDPDLDRLKALMRTPFLFDGRNVWSPDDARDAGFTYQSIGRP